MKKYKIFGMAEDRRHILDTMYNYSSKLADHIIKCVVYSGDIHYNHWVKEMATWIEDVNSMKPKKGFKIKSRDCKDNLFSGIGTELQDAKRALKRFKGVYVGTDEDEYPDFEITYELYSRLFDAFWELAEFMSPKVCHYSGTEDENKNLIIRDIHSILDKYCLKGDITNV